VDSTIGRVLGESIAKESTGGLSKHFKGFNWGGLGQYPEANLLVLESGGRIAIRDVSWQSDVDALRAFDCI
jgi:hypothetical protein